MITKMILIEGGIGVGKTTLCNLLKTRLSDVAIINTEPVDDWIKWTYKEKDYSFLGKFYNEKEKEKEIFNLQLFIECSMTNSLNNACWAAERENKKLSYATDR